MPRIPLLSPEDMTAEQRRVYELFTGVSKRTGRRAKGTPYQLTLHCPEFTEKWQQTGVLLRSRTSLPARLAELAMLVTVRHWECEYAWHTHSKSAVREGLSASVIEAIRSGQRPAFANADEAAIYDYCRELHETHFVSDDTYRAVLDRFGVVGVVELTALVGYYAMVAMTLNAHDQGLPSGVARALPNRR